MGAIELKMAMLSGVVLGLILVITEAVAMHRKVGRYIMHLRGLRRDGRSVRLFAEVSVVGFVVLIQLVIVAVLVSMALGQFNPQFPDHAMTQLKQGLHQGN